MIDPEREVPQATGSAPVRSGRIWQPATGAIPWLGTVAPVLIALLSLVVSLYTIVQSSREPEIWLSAPDVARIAMGERAWFYVQPRLVSAANNDRVAVITGLRLEVLAPGAAEPAIFRWDEQGTWQYDHATRSLTWIFVADAAPLVVGPSSPQLPNGLFEGPGGWTWQAGAYDVTIVASRGEVGEAQELRTSFTTAVPTEFLTAMETQPRVLWEVGTTPG